MENMSIDSSLQKGNCLKRLPVSVVGTTRLVIRVESLWGLVFVKACTVSDCSTAYRQNTGRNSGQPKVCQLQ